jgi:glycosyltransferase involved in cell wall biosynthesis
MDVATMTTDATAAASDVRALFGRVALTHEWLTVPGGSEKVVERLLGIVPQAELFTSVYEPSLYGPPISGREVHTSFIDRIPGARTHYPKLLPLMNQAFRRFDLDGFDLVVSSNHACAKNVRTPPGAKHLCYCHTPMRYAWEPEFLAGEDLGAVGRRVAPLFASHLRKTDRRAAAGPDRYVANSTHVALRIRTYYGREATVVHPPVDVDRFLDVPRAAGDYYLFFGRIVPYKRADLAVEACARLGRPLKVAGEGRAMDAARAVAGPQTEFLGRVSDAEVTDLFAGARALIFPGEEDFGIVPVEAQAAGVPVIAYGVGGARDSVLDGETGVLYDGAGVDGLVEAIERFEALELDEDAIRDNARRFAPEVFDRGIERELVLLAEEGRR